MEYTEQDAHIAQVVYEMFREAGAVLENDHFVLASGRHARDYIVHHAIYTDTNQLSLTCSLAARRVYDSDSGIAPFPDAKIDSVLGPASGGILLAQGIAESYRAWTALSLAAVWAEKETTPAGTVFRLPAAFEKHVRGKTVLLVDDVITTGGTFRKLAELVRAHEGKVAGCLCLWNRGNVSSAELDGIPLVSLIEKKLGDWPENACPCCKAGVPVNTLIGHGAEFVAKKRRR